MLNDSLLEKHFHFQYTYFDILSMTVPWLKITTSRTYTYMKKNTFINFYILKSSLKGMNK